ncbi:ABC transporter permease [Streptomyces sp. NPDC056716]|uniref:ABC transporter permease n=1 Tax=unclassified Streptomyces TaxID=2593676 RepID=UPI00368B2684
MAPVPPAPRPVTGRRLARGLIGTGVELIVPAGLITAWWLMSSGSTSPFFPPLSAILSALRETWLFAHFSSDALPSLGNLAVGYLIASAAGVLIGLVLGMAPVLGDAAAPVVEFLRAVPGVSLLPAAVLLLGIGSQTQIALIAYGAVWPVLLNTADGVRGIDPLVGEVGRSYRISRRDRVLRIVLRAASPQIVAGMRTALSIGITMIVFSEMVGSTEGIGYQILQSQRGFAVPEMWAGMVLLGILGYLLNIAFRGFENIVLKWHRGMRERSQ